MAYIHKYVLKENLLQAFSLKKGRKKAQVLLV